MKPPKAIIIAFSIMSSFSGHCLIAIVESGAGCFMNVALLPRAAHRDGSDDPVAMLITRRGHFSFFSE
jgi:hypothetical protein